LSSPIRKIFSDAVIYTVGSVFNRFLPFLLLPIYTYYFSPEHYGVFSLVYSFWFLIVVFYLYGMETAFQKHFIEAKSEAEKKTIFSSTLILLFITSLLFSIAVYSLSDFIALKLTGTEGNAYLIRVLAYILIIDVLYRFPMILINSMQRSKLYAGINAAGVILNVISNIIFIIYFEYGILSIFYAYLLSYAFVFIVSMAYTSKYFVFVFSSEMAKKLFRSAQLFLYYGLFIISIDLMDRFFLEYFKGTAEVGIYSACYRIGVVMNLVITGFKVAWTPFFLNMREDENNKEIFSKVFTYFCYGGLIAFLTFSLLADDIVKINISGYSLLNQKYWAGLVIIPYILLAYLFSGLYLNLTVASFFQNKIKYLIISSAVGCISNLILNFILIPPYSMLGAAIATMISYLIMFVVLYFFSQKIYKIHYKWAAILKAAVITAVIYFINIYIPDYYKFSYIYTLLIEFLSIIILFIVLLGKKSIIIAKSYKNRGT
jgi:O-antigen/teichoic acid export membrane protein